MEGETAHRFEFPVVKSELTPERCEAINRHFLEVARAASVNNTDARPAHRRGLADPLRKSTYTSTKRTQVKKG
jgi:hypothetical protein